MRQGLRNRGIESQNNLRHCHSNIKKQIQRHWPKLGKVNGELQ